MNFLYDFGMQNCCVWLFSQNVPPPTPKPSPRAPITEAPKHELIQSQPGAHQSETSIIANNERIDETAHIAEFQGLQYESRTSPQPDETAQTDDTGHQGQNLRARTFRSGDKPSHQELMGWAQNGTLAGQEPAILAFLESEAEHLDFGCHTQPFRSAVQNSKDRRLSQLVHHYLILKQQTQPRVLSSAKTAVDKFRGTWEERSPQDIKHSSTSEPMLENVERRSVYLHMALHGLHY